MVFENQFWAQYAIHILIGCVILAVAQTAHFYIYFEQPIWISVRWSIKGSIIWFLIIICTFSLVDRTKLKLGSRVFNITFWVFLALFCGALQVFIAVAIDAFLGTASRPFVDDFQHLYSKRWLQNSLVFGLFAICVSLSKADFQISNDVAHSLQSSDTLKIGDGVQTHWLKINEITFLESMGNYVSVYTIDTKYIVRKTLKNLVSELNSHGFIQVSRSAVVNQKYVDSYQRPSANKIELSVFKQHRVSVGRTYWKGVKDALNL